LGGVAAVDALIRAIVRADGRVTHDISRTLETLTGQDFHENGVLWHRWWKENRRSYRGPPEARAVETPDGATPEDPEAAARKKAWMERTKGTRFYGIRTRSKRIVYVLDVSSSMNAPIGRRSPTTTGTAKAAPPVRRKIDQARRELRSSVAALPEDAVFGIVFYNHEVHLWRKGLVEATDENKNGAGEWIESINAHGNTNIFDAVERAFGLAGRGTLDQGYETAADTVFLLSDGQANRGRLVDRDEMRREIGRMNRLKRVVIHTVALGGDADVAFMKGLAEDTGGQFKHVAGK
jgi:Mg-chelatase subunit ChlD